MADKSLLEFVRDKANELLNDSKIDDRIAEGLHKLADFVEEVAVKVGALDEPKADAPDENPDEDADDSDVVKPQSTKTTQATKGAKR
jgi:hypothetical protein